MPEASDGSEGSTNTVSNQLALLVPSFDPSKDDLQVYQQKVALLLEAWPSGRYTELATRLILNCVGSAFKKLQLHQSELIANDRKSIQRIIELLGGHWGQIDLEKKYEFAERALYRCSQKSDESADSYLARADIMWTELNSKKFQISDLQAYVTLRGSMLSPEDKKRVLVDADVVDKGELTVPRVSAAIRMLGAGFFQEMTSGKRAARQKTYDQATMMTEDVDEMDNDQYAMATDGIEDEDQAVETLAQEGDDDASLVMDFEAAAAEVLQSDQELASAFTAYTDARRRLNEKVRSRGFWPVSQKGKSKGSWKGVKGKFAKGHPSSRKSLQQRIMGSRCRLCNQVGHWKAECPNRREGASSSRAATAPTTFAQVIQAPEVSAPDALPLEFLNLPMHEETPIDVSQPSHVGIFMLQSMENATGMDNLDPKSKLQRSLRSWKNAQNPETTVARIEDDVSTLRQRLQRRVATLQNSQTCERSESEPVCFATHGSLGIVDLGATKTVIGSKLVPELLSSLDKNIRGKITRCPCAITFRFGNHGILQSQQALVVPISGLLLKIAVVPGSTPFLLSNTLLRTIEATIDTTKHVLHSAKLGKSFSLNLTSKGLFLLDLNDLAQPDESTVKFLQPAETHATVDGSSDVRTAVSKTLNAVAEDRDIHAHTFKATNISTDHSKGPINHHNEEHSQIPQSISHPTESSQFEPDETVERKTPFAVLESNDSSNTSRSKHVPRSFQVPPRHGHVHVGSETSKGPAAIAGSRIRLQPHVDGHAGGHQDQLRQDTCGEDVQPHVVRRATMGDVVHTTLSPKHQGGTPAVPVLCGQEDRKVRTHWCESAEPQCGRSESRGQPEAAVTAQGSDAQGESQEHADAHSPDGPMGSGDRGGCGVVRSSAGAGTLSSDRACDACPTDAAHGESHATDGRRPQSDRQLHRAELDHSDLRAVSPGDDLEDAGILLAGDLSADCPFQNPSTATPESNRERIHFQNLIQQFSKELNQVIKQCDSKAQRLDLLEVFCGPQSQLTAQASKLGYRAERFGMAQGDLHSHSGRRELFSKLVMCKPRNVWFSPTCGPWSGFSCLNGSRSLDSWDALQQDRMKHLEQIALGVVILRFQRQHSCHMHWEQPRGSIMFKLPYMQEVRCYMLAVDVDLCTAGNLRDPINGLFIKKGLIIMTSSNHMVKSLHGLRCAGNHEHQVIEGQVSVNGQMMNRSTFTENYPRKFARKLAIIMGKIHKPHEVPYSNDVWPLLAAEEHPESPSPKRPKLLRYTSTKLSRTLEVSQIPWGKRQKCSVKTKPLDGKGLWSQVFEKMHSLLPRVGKKCIHDPDILEMCQRLIPDKEIVSIVACRGASRTLAPPEQILKGMAPLRRSIFTERGSGEIRAEEEWEPWENLAKRNLISHIHTPAA